MRAEAATNQDMSLGTYLQDWLSHIRSRVRASASVTSSTSAGMSWLGTRLQGRTGCAPFPRRSGTGGFRDVRSTKAEVAVSRVVVGRRG
jgi:hypothetical protein